MHQVNAPSCITKIEKLSPLIDYVRRDRLNHLMILQAHKERTDALDLKEVVNEYISGCEHRLRMFDFWLHFCTAICNHEYCNINVLSLGS